MDKRSDIELLEMVGLPLKLNTVRNKGEEKESHQEYTKEDSQGWFSD